MHTCMHSNSKKPCTVCSFIRINVQNLSQWHQFHLPQRVNMFIFHTARFTILAVCIHAALLLLLRGIHSNIIGDGRQQLTHCVQWRNDHEEPTNPDRLADRIGYGHRNSRRGEAQEEHHGPCRSRSVRINRAQEAYIRWLQQSLAKANYRLKGKREIEYSFSHWGRSRYSSTL